MVERQQKHESQKLLGNHQKCWIWGRNTVTETLIADRWLVHELHLSQSLSEADRQHWEQVAKQQQIPTSIKPHDELQRICRSAEHQGMIAKMSPFPYNDWAELFTQQVSAPLYVILDAVQDPYNFGAIIRSAEVLGATAILIKTEKQVGVTSLVARTSAGAVNFLPIVRVDHLPKAVQQLRENNVTFLAACESKKLTNGTISISPAEHNFCLPTAVIIGNEGRGIRDELLQEADYFVSIPQSGRVNSLNAAVAASVLCYEASRQRTTAEEITKS